MGNDHPPGAAASGAIGTAERPAKLRYTDPQGTVWRVYDALYGPPYCRPGESRTVAAGSHPRAEHRVFIRARDRLRFNLSLIREDLTDLSLATLTAQLGWALRGGPSFIQAPGAPPWRELYAQWLADPVRELARRDPVPEASKLCAPGCPTCDYHRATRGELDPHPSPPQQASGASAPSGR